MIITTGSANQRSNTPCLRLWIDVLFRGVENSYIFPTFCDRKLILFHKGIPWSINLTSLVVVCQTMAANTQGLAVWYLYPPPPPPPPPQTKFYRGGYIGINLSESNLSFCPSRLFISCPGHNFSPTCPTWITFHTIVVHNLRVCHDLDPRSYLQGQGHSVLIPKIRVRAITPHCQIGSGYYFTPLLSITQGCVMTLIQGHISKFKVTVNTYWKCVPGS